MGREYTISWRPLTEGTTGQMLTNSHLAKVSGGSLESLDHKDMIRSTRHHSSPTIHSLLRRFRCSSGDSPPLAFAGHGGGNPFQGLFIERMSHLKGHAVTDRQVSRTDKQQIYAVD